MDALFQRFRKQEGRLGAGRHLGLGLTWGRFWSRRSGCCNLYQGCGHVDDINYEDIRAVGPSEGEMELIGVLVCEPDTDYFYAVRRVSGSGKQEQGTQAVVKFSLDENGKVKSDRPNRILDLTAHAVPVGRVKLYWWYWCMGQEVEPRSFRIYGDNGSGEIDYEQEVAEVDYAGSRLYNYVSSVGVDGKVYRFSVRAVGDNGVDDGSLSYAEARVDLSGPESLDGLIGSMGF